MVIACEMLNMSLNSRVVTKSSLNISFSIAYPSVSETIGFLDKQVEHRRN